MRASPSPTFPSSLRRPPLRAPPPARRTNASAKWASPRTQSPWSCRPYSARPSQSRGRRSSWTQKRAVPAGAGASRNGAAPPTRQPASSALFRSPSGSRTRSRPPQPSPRCRLRPAALSPASGEALRSSRRPRPCPRLPGTRAPLPCGAGGCGRLLPPASMRRRRWMRSSQLARSCTRSRMLRSRSSRRFPHRRSSPRRRASEVARLSAT